MLDYLFAKVRLHLLTAAMKCFFKRPPETQVALGAALAAGIADFHQVGVNLHLVLFSCQVVFHVCIVEVVRICILCNVQ